MNEHERYMQTAITLAAKGRGAVSPNPLVGAVIVKNGNIIGRGFHQRYKGPHAEVNAIASCSESPEGATLYCTLEPCASAYEGKHNRPCCERILEAGIKRVFIANRDPHSKTNGSSIAFLGKHGIKVDTGLLAEKAAKANEVYLYRHQTGRPFVHLKLAMSLDGKIASSCGESKWISCLEARKKVHALRSAHDAILVGSRTYALDRPELSVRLVPGRDPVRVVLIGRKFCEKAYIEDPSENKTLFLTPCDTQLPEGLPGTRNNMKIVRLEPEDEGRLSVSRILEALSDEKLYSVLVEGGSRVFSAFYESGLWDKASFHISPGIMGDGIDAAKFYSCRGPGDMKKLVHVSTQVPGETIIVEGYREELHVHRID